MGKHLFWKVSLSLILSLQAAVSAELRVGTLSEGACWYESKESLRVASFNDKSAYLGNKEQIIADLEALIATSIGKTEHTKIQDMDLALHCGGYGASLVAKVTTDTSTFCIWSKFDKGNLGLRSIGVLGAEQKNTNDLCDGRKWGEFIVGGNSQELITELQSPKWSSMIKSVSLISDKVYKVVLVKDFEFREQEVIDQIQENFVGRNLIRYIEFNDYRHPVGEFVHMRN